MISHDVVFRIGEASSFSSSKFSLRLFIHWARKGKKFEIHSINSSDGLIPANVASRLIFILCASSSATARLLHQRRL
jgi:hypothetical protein